MDHSPSYSDPVVLKDSPLVRCEPQYGAIVCLGCNNGYPWSRIASHFSHARHASSKIYEPILKTLPHETLANDWENLRRPSDNSPPIEGLQIRVGYVCRGCDYRTTSDQTARKHSKCAGRVDQVHLQSWNPTASRTFWIVSEPTPSIATSSAGLFLPFSPSFLLLSFFSDDI